MNIPTPHIEVNSLNIIAKTVLMPGDPLRAKFIAETYLDAPLQLFNQVRGMLGYTGYYQGKKVSIMGSGMGIPSIGIYSFELFNFYNVDNIIRVGSCGSYNHDYKINDVILATEAFSESTYAIVQNGDTSPAFLPSKELNQKIIASAEKTKLPIKLSKIHSSDVFYRCDPNQFKNTRDIHGCNVVEMEAFALFANAKKLNKSAACLLTVSDSIVTNEATSAAERQNSFHKMIELALDAV